MTLAQYLRVLRQQWFIVMLLTALAVGGAAAYTFRQTPIYSASTQLFVSVSTADSDISQLTQGSTFTQQRVKSYADIVTSPSVLDSVVQRLRLPITAQALAGQVTVDTPLDTVLINVSVTDSNPQLAADIANEIAGEFPAFVTNLETPTGDVKSPVKISVTDKATVPTMPVSPRIPLNLALGLLVGLGLGVGVAVLREQLNTSVNGVADIEKLTGAIPLGVVPFDSTAGKQPLVDTDQQSGRAEAFRTLRTNLQFADVDNPPRVIVVTSPLPAEGKSTSACNVALTLALGGARVVLVDGDLRKPSVGKYLGISSAAGLSSVLAGQHELRDVIVTYGRDTLSVLPSGPTVPNPSELLGSQHMVDLITVLANHYDIVVIDAPPLLPVTDAAVLASAADGAVLVVRYGVTRREELKRAMQTLDAVNAKLLGTVMNFAPKRKRRGAYDGYGYGYGYGTAASSPASASVSASSASASSPSSAAALLASAGSSGSTTLPAMPGTAPSGASAAAHANPGVINLPPAPSQGRRQADGQPAHANVFPIQQSHNGHSGAGSVPASASGSASSSGSASGSNGYSTTAGNGRAPADIESPFPGAQWPQPMTNGQGLPTAWRPVAPVAPEPGPEPASWPGAEPGTWLGSNAGAGAGDGSGQQPQTGPFAPPPNGYASQSSAAAPANSGDWYGAPDGFSTARQPNNTYLPPAGNPGGAYLPPASTPPGTYLPPAGNPPGSYLPPAGNPPGSYLPPAGNPPGSYLAPAGSTSPGTGPLLLPNGMPASSNGHLLGGPPPSPDTYIDVSALNGADDSPQPHPKRRLGRRSR